MPYQTKFEKRPIVGLGHRIELTDDERAERFKQAVCSQNPDLPVLTRTQLDDLPREDRVKYRAVWDVYVPVETQSLALPNNRKMFL